MRPTPAPTSSALIGEDRFFGTPRTEVGGAIADSRGAQPSKNMREERASSKGTGLSAKPKPPKTPFYQRGQRYSWYQCEIEDRETGELTTEASTESQ